MPASNRELPPRAIATWSEPLIADYIFAAYERCCGGPSDVAEAMARQHCLLWRNLIYGQPTIAAYLRRELLKAAETCKFGGGIVDAIDIGVFDHLLDVVMRRGQRSRDLARNDGMALVHAASTLGEIRKVA